MAVSALLWSEWTKLIFFGFDLNQELLASGRFDDAREDEKGEGSDQLHIPSEGDATNEGDGGE